MFWFAGLNSFRTNNGDGTSRSAKAGFMSQMTSHRSYLDSSMMSSGDEHPTTYPHVQLPHINLGSHRQGGDTGFPDEPTTGGNTRMLTWRGGEDSIHTVSTTVIGGKMPAHAPSGAYQLAQEKVLRSRGLSVGAHSVPGGGGHSAFAEFQSSPLDDFIPQDVPETYKLYLGLGVGLQVADVQLMLRAYGIVAAILLQRAVMLECPRLNAVGNAIAPAQCVSHLDHVACTPGIITSPLHFSNNSAGVAASGAADGANLMFAVREYLEVAGDLHAPTNPSPSTHSDHVGMKLTADSDVHSSPLGGAAIPSLRTGSPAFAATDSGVLHDLMGYMMQESPTAARLCKLLHGDYLKHCCVAQHINDNDLSEKIGEGGFGTVFRVTCNCAPSTGFAQYSNCLACYQTPGVQRSDGPSCSCWRSCRDRDCTTRQASFAVKRIPRERSMHDPSRLYDLYTEITALETLRTRGAIGICGIEDYGVVGSEFWMILELGRQNVEEFRCAMTCVSPHRDTSSGRATPLSMQQVATCLCLFVDAVLAVQSVHDADIAHFDIKCSNFVLRQQTHDASDPQLLHNMHSYHKRGLPSGEVFLCDFGEAVPFVSSPASAAQLQSRCRGTLHTQSPEMLCISHAPGTASIANGSTTGSGQNSAAGHSTKEGATVTTPGGAMSPNGSAKKNGRRAFCLPDRRSDIWSVGCLLVEILTGQALFADKPWPELYMTLCMERYTMLDILVPAALNSALSQVPDAVQARLVDLVLSVLQQMPESRPELKAVISTVNDILREHFFGYLQPHVPVHANAHGAKNKNIVPPSVDGVAYGEHLATLRSQVLHLQPSDALSLRCGERVRLLLGHTHDTAEGKGDSVLAPLGSLPHEVYNARIGTLPAAAPATNASEHVVRVIVTDHDGCVPQKEAPASNTVLVLQTSNNFAEMVKRIQHIGSQIRDRVAKSAHTLSAVEVTVGASISKQGGGGVITGPELTVSCAVCCVLSTMLQPVEETGRLLRNPCTELAGVWRALPWIQAACDREVVHALEQASLQER
jgi:serine/threonine protein kinase